MDFIDEIHLWIDALSTHVNACGRELTEHVVTYFQSLKG